MQLIFIIITIVLSDFISAQDDSGDPLFLTPLLKNGQFNFAKNLARVRHSDMGSVESYAGYLTTNLTYNSNIFFWYFPAEQDPENAPVLLWLQGGPGASSLIGLFFENGPFNINQNGRLEMREFSWTTNHHVIYLDSPVGVGYSFTEDEAGYANDVNNDVALGVQSALIQLLNLFPEIQPNDFYVTGESYAGKYVPAVTKAIKDFNVGVKRKINLQGFAVGSGFSDPINQINYGDYLYQIGLIDANGRDQFRMMENEAINLTMQEKWLDAFNAYDRILNGDLTTEPTLFKNLTGFDNYFNYINPQALNLDIFSEWVQMLDVRRALHVGNNLFSVLNETVEQHLLGDFMQSQSPIIEELINDYKFLVWNGQLDVITAYPLAQNYLQNLNWSGANDYLNAERRQWLVGGDLAGYSKSGGNLTEVFVRNAGHLTPADQPAWTFDMITRFTHNQPF